MKILLTSAGIKNTSIHNALVDLLGKPIAESNALVIPTAIYPFPGGAYMAGRLIRGEVASPLAGLGWKSLGVLELTALPSIDSEAWIPTVREADALLVWGGDPLFLSHWMRQSGLADLLPSLRPEAVYVGVSAGSMAATSAFSETYRDPPRGDVEALTSEDIVFATPEGDINRILVTAQGVGLVDFALIPHLDHADHPDASLANAEKWAARNPCQRTQSTIRPPYEWSTEPLTSSPRAIGQCLPRNKRIRWCGVGPSAPRLWDKQFQTRYEV